MGKYSVVGSGADCKSVTFGSGGSIPSFPTIKLASSITPPRGDAG